MEGVRRLQPRCRPRPAGALRRQRRRWHVHYHRRSSRHLRPVGRAPGELGEHHQHDRRPAGHDRLRPDHHGRSAGSLRALRRYRGDRVSGFGFRRHARLERAPPGRRALLQRHRPRRHAGRRRARRRHRRLRPRHVRRRHRRRLPHHPRHPRRLEPHVAVVRLLRRRARPQPGEGARLRTATRAGTPTSPPRPPAPTADTSSPTSPRGRTTSCSARCSAGCRRRRWSPRRAHSTSWSPSPAARAPRAATSAAPRPTPAASPAPSTRTATATASATPASRR